MKDTKISNLNELVKHKSSKKHIIIDNIEPESLSDRKENSNINNLPRKSVPNADPKILKYDKLA